MIIFPMQCNGPVWNMPTVHVLGPYTVLPLDTVPREKTPTLLATVPDQSLRHTGFKCQHGAIQYSAILSTLFMHLPTVCKPSHVQLGLTDAGRVVLRETRWAFTGKASQRVGTQELAVVLFGLTFIKVWGEREASENGCSCLALRPRPGSHRMRACSTREHFV